MIILFSLLVAALLLLGAWILRSEHLFRNHMSVLRKGQGGCTYDVFASWQIWGTYITIGFIKDFKKYKLFLYRGYRFFNIEFGKQ